MFGTRGFSAEQASFSGRIANPTESAISMSAAILCSNNTRNPVSETSVLMRDEDMGSASIFFGGGERGMCCSISDRKLRVNATGDNAVAEEIESDGTKSQTASTVALFRLALETDRLLVLHAGGAPRMIIEQTESGAELKRWRN
ncbi:MAG: hypothetical protein JSS49_19495 [Planctomycetes bacterium]|nr:hypothetical protein [Planctomycetota bacterium]